jgi:hypothetical protein
VIVYFLYRASAETHDYMSNHHRTVKGRFSSGRKVWCFPVFVLCKLNCHLKHFLCKKEHLRKQFGTDCIAVHGSDWFHKGYSIRVRRFQTENFEIL